MAGCVSWETRPILGMLGKDGGHSVRYWSWRQLHLACGLYQCKHPQLLLSSQVQTVGKGCIVGFIELLSHTYQSLPTKIKILASGCKVECKVPQVSDGHGHVQHLVRGFSIYYSRSHCIQSAEVGPKILNYSLLLSGSWLLSFESSQRCQHRSSSGKAKGYSGFWIAEITQIWPVSSCPNHRG